MNESRIFFKEVSEYLRPICLDVEKNISNLLEIDAEIRAKENSIRHAHTLKTMINYCSRLNKNSLDILNASGLGTGHQDFSLVSYFLERTNIDLKWVAYESPNSPHIKNNLFMTYISKLDIDLRLCDLKNDSSNLYGKKDDIKYDIIIFTEIAEHLDHSTLIQSLVTLREKLKDDGMLIVTTPNLVSLLNRIRILFGYGDGPYFGDGTENYMKGLYGHIVLYDSRRLKRLLSDIGFKINETYTFTCGYGLAEKECIKNIASKLLGFMNFLFRGVGKTLFMTCQKSDYYKKIPFQI